MRETNKRIFAILGIFACLGLLFVPSACASGFTPLVGEIDTTILTDLLPTIVELMLIMAVIAILMKIMGKLSTLGGK